MSLDYILKFNQLPVEVRERVSSPAVMAALDNLESQYHVNLASLVMMAVVGEVKISDLDSYLLNNFKLSPDVSVALAKDLRDKVLFGLTDHLIFVPPKSIVEEPEVMPEEELAIKSDEQEETVIEIPKSSRGGRRKNKEESPAANVALMVEPNILPDVAANHSEAEVEVIELAEELEHLSDSLAAPSPDSLASEVADIMSVAETQEEIKAQPSDLPAVVPAKSVAVAPAALPITLDEPIKQEADYFNDKDEEEIKQIASKMEPAEEKPDESKSQEDVLTLLKQAQISFSSQILVDRFTQILASYLRGIRDKIDVREALSKEIVSGGLGLDAGEVDNILALADNFKPDHGDLKLEAPKRIILPEDKLASDRTAVLKEIGARDVEYDLVKAIAERQGKTEAEVNSSANAAVQPKTDSETTASVVPPQAPETTTKRGFFFFSKPSIGNKTRMQDVKAPRTMGPIDELRYLDAISFRRLSRVADEATAKIKEKLKLLEKEQYSKRLLGIKAWRQSPLNQLYLNMTQAALSQRISIDQLISQKFEAKEDCLNQAEFEAIMKLNQDLRF
ncbi:hypothetical protein HGA64_00780 [Candidatus Falkowbacteria bacterium]|nr:hypothetical protein [Candidatus Falkowbacteria bacterium]